jgi:hypothetical protein
MLIRQNWPVEWKWVVRLKGKMRTFQDHLVFLADVIRLTLVFILVFPVRMLLDHLVNWEAPEIDLTEIEYES